MTKISDFMTYRQFRRTDLYNKYYRPKGIPYGIAFGISLAQDGLIGIGLHRSGKDYSERDRRILSELHPHILQAFKNAQIITGLRRDTATLHDALNSLNSAIVCLSTESTVRWMTPRAETLLRNYQSIVPRSHNRLHAPIVDWLKQQTAALLSCSNLPEAVRPLTIQGADGILTIRLMRQGPFHLLVLDESRTVTVNKELQHLGLSRRESEILGWLVQGKTNPEIAMILGISRRTVQKHLERVYSRLGVENRHAAMTVAMEAMKRGRIENGYS